jgi:cell division protein FtsZ
MFEGFLNADRPHDDEGLFSNEHIRIAVVGVGGAGCNTVNRMMKIGITSARTIAVNTDKLHLDVTNAHEKVLIGGTMTKGLGAGGFPEIGARCAEASRDALRKAIAHNELVFLCSGMGGGTGTGASPVIAEIAKEEGAIVISVVTYPFSLERARLKKAEWGLKELATKSDTVIVVDNNRLLSYVPNLPMAEAFNVADAITTRAVKGIADAIILPSLMNVDFADVRSVMENGGIALISIGDGKGNDRVDQVVKSTLAHPLLDVDYEGAKGALVHLTGGVGLTLGEAIEIGERLTDSFDPCANVKVGARLSPEQDEVITATLIATGLRSQQIIGAMSKTAEANTNKVEMEEVAIL